jgi:hypothetical protein
MSLRGAFGSLRKVKGSARQRACRSRQVFPLGNLSSHTGAGIPGKRGSPVTINPVGLAIDTDHLAQWRQRRVPLDDLVARDRGQKEDVAVAARFAEVETI